MKLGIISDLHIDLLEQNSNNFFEDFIAFVVDSKIDVLLIAGDISEDCTKTIAFSKNLKKSLLIPFYYTPGNHDLWNKHNQLKTSTIIEQLKEDSNCLFNRSVQINDLEIIGHVGWYDYSFASKNMFEANYLSQKKHLERTWQDFYYIDFQASDSQICRQFNEEINFLIQKSTSNKIVIMNHMVNHFSFLVPPCVDEKWNFFNAFLGNKDLVELTKNEKVKVAICGHVHYRRTIQEADKSYVCACLGYEKEWKLFDSRDTSLHHQLKKAMQIIEL